VQRLQRTDCVRENYSLGGKNKTHAHEDLVLRRATFELDGKVVVENGEIVPEEVK
jgi:leucyl aminopeptidase (aminopeptidase T)